LSKNKLLCGFCTLFHLWGHAGADHPHRHRWASHGRLAGSFPWHDRVPELQL